MGGRRVLRGATLLALDGRSGLRQTDLLIEEGRIAAIGGVAAPDAEVEHVRGVVMPGLVQALLHLDLSLQDQGFVAAQDPRLHLHTQRPAWRAGLDEPALATSVRAGLAWTLAAGATTVADPSSARHGVGALGALPASGVRMVIFVDATRADVSEARMILAEALAAQQLEVPAQVALWAGDAERTSARRLRVAAQIADAEGCPLVVQVGLRSGLRGAVERLERCRALGPRTVLTHGLGANLGGPRAVRRIADAGASVVVTPSFEVLCGAPPGPIPALLEAGVSVGLGSECGAPRLGLDLFEEARLALRLLEGRALAPATAALSMATRHGADALGLSAGSIEVGRAADLLLVGIEPEPGDDQESMARRIIESAGPEHIHRAWVAGQPRAADGPGMRAPDEAELLRARQGCQAGSARSEGGPASGVAVLRDLLGRRFRAARGWHAGRWP